MSERIEVEAVAIPVIPHTFYGSAELSGKPAPAGSVITAIVAGQAQGIIAGNPRVTEVDGVYAKTGMMELKLYIQGDIAANAPITFYINGALAECQVPGGAWVKTWPFTAGAVTQLNLRASTPTYAWKWTKVI